MPTAPACSVCPVPDSLVLASASPRRRELLAALGVPFEVRAVDVPERLVKGIDVVEQAKALALAKARAVARTDGRAVILGADTIVVLDGAPLGKPADADEARRMLRALRGRAHEVITGVAAVSGRDGDALTDGATTLVHMRDYTDAESDAYIATGDPFDKAGAYAIQHAGFAPVARSEGCYCNVMGLPLWTARRLLRRAAAGLATRPPNVVYERCAACPLA
jgi:MAF protein